jgi:hypothetical protein
MSATFEAQVNVEVREDGARSPLGARTVMGGSMGTVAPFDRIIAFAPLSALVVTSACPDYAMTRPMAPPGEMVVTVFSSCGLDGAPVPTCRLHTKSAARLRVALGPRCTARRTDRTGTGGRAFELVLGGDGWLRPAGHSRRRASQRRLRPVDFGDLRSVIPNASTSAGSRLLSQLDATVFQFPTVTSVTYRIDGSCQAFGEWLQVDGCVPRTRSVSS